MPTNEEMNECWCQGDQVLGILAGKGVIWRKNYCLVTRILGEKIRTSKAFGNSSSRIVLFQALLGQLSRRDATVVWPLWDIVGHDAENREQRTKKTTRTKITFTPLNFNIVTDESESLSCPILGVVTWLDADRSRCCASASRKISGCQHSKFS